MVKKVLIIHRVPAPPAISELLAGAGYGVDATTTYPDYKPAPFIVSQEIDGVDMVTDAAAGLRQLDAPDYDAVIVLDSPLAESWKLCARIRQLTDIPLVVISPRASTEMCVRAINAGADYFIRKPFGPRELLSRVGSLVQRTAPLAAPRTIARSGR